MNKHVCCKNSLNQCRSHKSFPWDKPELYHEHLSTKSLQKEENILKLIPDKTSNIKKNLTKKIQIVNNCTHMIIHQTLALITQIQSKCTEAIKILKAKEQYYVTLLKISQKAYSLDARKKFQKELTLYLVISSPPQEIKEIEAFYNYNFLTEIEKASKLRYMKTHEFRSILEEEYKLPLVPHSKCVQLKGHENRVTTLAITSDNKYIISGSSDCTVRIWDLQEKKEKAILRGHTDEIVKVVVTSDNKFIVSASNDTTLIIWNIQEKMMETRLRGHAACVQILQISSDNKFIVSAGGYIISSSSYNGDLPIRIWNLQEKRLESILEGHTGLIEALVLTHKKRTKVP